MIACGVTVAAAQQPPAPPLLQEPQTLLLWPGGAPGALGQEDSDKPAITVYMPPNTTGPMTAVIIAPGGSYARLSMNNEGRAPANFLNSLGIAAFVLRYRLGPAYHHPIELGDAQRAIRTVRSRADEWHIAADRIGIMGFSAGGHLASSASTHFDAGQAGAADPIDRVSSRPDFAVLGYPVISLVEAFAHQGSKTNLLGEHPDPALARSLSSESQVTASTPADIHLPDQRRHGSAGGERGRLFSGPAEGRRAGGAARVPQRRARHRTRADRIRRWPNGRGCWRTGCASAGS